MTIGQIKKFLYEEYEITLTGIPYINGVADFSSISVAHISTDDIVIKALGISPSKFNSLSTISKLNLYKKVFGEADGKKKRNSNFDIADEIAASRQIPIPGLPEGYTATQLKKWRETHHFSWDEQLYGGYNLVPSVIHGNLSHTGLVSVITNAYRYLKRRKKAMKRQPEQFYCSEENAVTSITELFKKKSSNFDIGTTSSISTSRSAILINSL